LGGLIGSTIGNAYLKTTINLGFLEKYYLINWIFVLLSIISILLCVFYIRVLGKSKNNPKKTKAKVMCLCKKEYCKGAGIASHQRKCKIFQMQI
jgi:hypothetical protein